MFLTSSASVFLSFFLYCSVFQCPHELMCPKLAIEPTPCNFQQMYHPLPLPGVRLNSGLYVCLKVKVLYWSHIRCSVKFGLGI